MYSNRLESKRSQLNTILERVKKASYRHLFIKAMKKTKSCAQFAEIGPVRLHSLLYTDGDLLKLLGKNFL